MEPASPFGCRAACDWSWDEFYQRDIVVAIGDLLTQPLRPTLQPHVAAQRMIPSMTIASTRVYGAW